MIFYDLAVQNTWFVLAKCHMTQSADLDKYV